MATSLYIFLCKMKGDASPLCLTLLFIYSITTLQPRFCIALVFMHIDTHTTPTPSSCSHT